MIGNSIYTLTGVKHTDVILNQDDLEKIAKALPDSILKDYIKSKIEFLENHK